MTQTTQDQVNQTAWAACDTFRGVVDAGLNVVTNSASAPESQEPIPDPARFPPHELKAVTGPMSAAGREYGREAVDRLAPDLSGSHARGPRTADSADAVCRVTAGHHPVTFSASIVRPRSAALGTE